MWTLRPFSAVATALLWSMMSGWVFSPTASFLLVGQHQRNPTTLLWSPSFAFHEKFLIPRGNDVNAASSAAPVAAHRSSARWTTTALLRSSDSDSASSSTSPDVDGQGRGKYIMSFVLFLCIWIFSIPPEFRRAHICTTSAATIRSDCVSLGDWTQQVGDYYKGGGGVHFDFSIDQSTKDFWAGK